MEDMDITERDQAVAMQELQDENVRLKQLLRNRILPQQENASKLMNETFLKIKKEFSRRLSELRTEMNYFQKRINDLSELEAQMTEFQTLQERLDAEQIRMVLSLPEDALPSTPKFNSTPKKKNPNFECNGTTSKEKSATPVENEAEHANSNSKNVSTSHKMIELSNDAPGRSLSQANKVQSSNLKANAKNTNENDSKLAVDVTEKLASNKETFKIKIPESPPWTPLQDMNGLPNTPITKVFPQTAKSPALSLIVEESVLVTPQQRQNRKRQLSEVPSENRSKSQLDTTDASENQSGADLSVGRMKRRAAVAISTFKEPSLKKKMRQKKT